MLQYPYDPRVDQRKNEKLALAQKDCQFAAAMASLSHEEQTDADIEHEIEAAYAIMLEADQKLKAKVAKGESFGFKKGLAWLLEKVGHDAGGDAHA
jgi:hypothetical protein